MVHNTYTEIVSTHLSDFHELKTITLQLLLTINAYFQGELLYAPKQNLNYDCLMANYFCEDSFELAELLLV